MTSASPNAPPLRILIVDDDAFFRRGVREILNEAAGMRVVGEAGDGDQAVEVARELCRHTGIDLVLIDIELPNLDGLAATEQLVSDYPDLAVVVLTLSTADHDLLQAVRAGAVGFVSKSLAPDKLVETLRAFQYGGSLPFSRDIGQKVLGFLRHGTEPEPGPESGQPRLTAREHEVLELVANGARDRDIAQRLVVSESTVKKHLQNILRKFQARNRAEAVARWRGLRSG